MKNYIFSGFGHASGEFEVSNNDIIEAIRKKYLKGFREEKIKKSKNYQSFLKSNPGTSPFDYFAGHKMGFFIRKHVAPFPPSNKKLFYAETSLELGVKAIKNALLDAELQAKDIAAWFVSTVSPHEQAPGIASTIKAHFTDFENNTPTFTLTSGCSGFNLNLQHAMEYLENNPDAEHVVVAHTETMSCFLTQRTKFVPFVTFGDAGAAVILSRKESKHKEGLINITNYQDMQMIDFVGVDKESDLYMDDSVIKDRAIINMSVAGKEMLKLTKWKPEDVDFFIPHQTGNAILYPTAQELGFNPSQLLTEAQNKYGNVSGATVAISLSVLNSENRLKKGKKIMSTVAGVGGKYGAFAYIVPDKEKHKNYYFYSNDLKGKKCMITGSNGALGSEISIEAAKRGAGLILHIYQEDDKFKELIKELNELNAEYQIYKSDFRNKEDVQRFAEKIRNDNEIIHYLVHAAGISENLNLKSKISTEDIMQVNCFSTSEISKILINNIAETVLYIGSSSEDIPLEGFPSYNASKACLHGFAGSAAGEFLSKGIRTIYYIPGILDEGLSRNIPEKAAFNFMLKNGQETAIRTTETAFRILNSLYIPKVMGVLNSYEGPMITRRDGYVLKTDV